MSDRDLIVAAAEKVMGWLVFTSGRGSTVAWEGPDEIEHILATTHPWESVDWSPLSNDADAFMLVDALDRITCDFSLEKCGEVWYAAFGAVGCYGAVDRRRAIVISALRAVGVEV